MDVDPNIPCEKLRSILEASIKSESDIVLTKMILDEFLRVEAVIKKQYINICRNTWYASYSDLL